MLPPKSKRTPQCEVCLDQNFKYTCPQCQIVYCSLACYKKHKGLSCIPKRNHLNNAAINSNESLVANEPKSPITTEEANPADPVVLRPLTSLKWPYVPEESAFPDPLKRDDPKVLNLSQYEAIGVPFPPYHKRPRLPSEKYKNPPTLLTSVDKLRSPEREEALQRTLGITAPEIDDQLCRPELSEDVLALRELAEAIEGSVRGDNETALGLNWAPIWCFV